MRMPCRSLCLSALLALSLLGTGAAHAGEQPLTVMTYNVYLGSDTSTVFSAPPAEIPLRVGEVYRQAIASDFGERAGSIARSIADHRPHLVALQEMSLIRRQTPGDILAGQVAPNAADVVLDFRSVLMSAIGAENLKYSIAAEVRNMDVEMPMLTGDGSVDDVRLTMFDVILSREDVPVSRVAAKNYGTELASPLGFSIARGYVAVDAEISGQSYRFVNTHLEAFSGDVRRAQADELIAALEGETLPLIVSGDFNSDADAPPGTPARAVYDLLGSQGYADVWRGEPGTGATCCQAPDLQNASSQLSMRIDHVFIRNIDASSIVSVNTVGNRTSDRVPAGFWPSDHAGVVLSVATR